MMVDGNLLLFLLIIVAGIWAEWRFTSGFNAGVVSGARSGMLAGAQQCIIDLQARRIIKVLNNGTVVPYYGESDESPYR